jgi:Fe-Mn family superoxide dismutase
VNTTLETLAGAQSADDVSAIVGLEKTLAFKLSGHAVHTLFWQNLTPGGTDRPSGELAAAIDERRFE